MTCRTETGSEVNLDSAPNSARQSGSGGFGWAPRSEPPLLRPGCAMSVLLSAEEADAALVSVQS